MTSSERFESRQETALYTCVTGYRADDEVRTWEGRGADGTSLGIIELTVNIPFIPGNINNASTFDFPVRYESLGEIDPTWVVSSDPHPEVIKNLGTVKTNKKTNAFNKSDEEACMWVFLSAMIALKKRALDQGANAVVSIKSNYRDNETSSETTFRCGAGALIAGVALKGTLVQLEE